MKNLTYSFISTNTEDFKQATDLKYDAFYKDMGLPKSITTDDIDDISEHFVVKHNEKVIGCCRLTPEKSQGKISQMAVHKDWQKKGIGNIIMQELLKKAKTFNIHHFYLEARLPAVGFYKKFNFQEVGEIFPTEKTGIPHIKMELDL